MRTIPNTIINTLTLFICTILGINIVLAIVELMEISIIVGFFTLAFIFLILWLLKSKNIFKWELKNKHAVIVLISCSLLIGLISIFTSNIILELDPKFYYQTGSMLSKNFSRFNPSNLYHQRALFYTLPILKFISNDLIYIQLFNIAILLITAYLFYVHFIKYSSNEISLLFLFLFLTIPSHYFAINVPSHDIMSLFYLICFLMLFEYISNKKNAILIILAGILLFILDFQRTTGIFVILALLLSSGFNLIYTRNYSHILKTLAVIIIFFALHFTISHAFLNGKQDHSKYLYSNMIYSYNNLNSDGSYGSGVEPRYFFSVLPEDMKNTYGLTKFASQIVDFPVHYVKFIFRKDARFLNNSPYHFSFMDQKFKKHRNAIFMRGINLFYQLQRTLIFLFSIIGVLVLLRNKSNIARNFIFLYPVAYIAIITISQSNSNYSYILMPFFCFFAAIGINHYVKNGISIQPKNIDIKNIGISILSLFTVLFVVYFLAFIYLKVSQRYLVNFNDNTLITTNFSGENAEGNRYSKAYSRHYTFEEDKFQCQIKINKGNYKNISFFLKTNINPNKLDIRINNEEAKIKGSPVEIDSVFYCFINAKYDNIKDNGLIELSSEQYSPGNNYLTVQDIIVEN